MTYKAFLPQKNELEPVTKLETRTLSTLLHGVIHFTESNWIHANYFVMKHKYINLKVLSQWLYAYKYTKRRT